MPSYTQCSKEEATHLEASTPRALLGRTCKIVQKVDHGFLVRFTIGVAGHYDYAYVRNADARLFKEYVPPVVTYGVGRMDKVHTPYGDIPALALGEGRLADRKACEEFMRRSTYVKWTHVITYHDNKPVGIEELL